MYQTDSRKVKKGDIFVAIKGHNVDGHKYINEAIKAGAIKLVVEKGTYDIDYEIVDNTKEYLKNKLKNIYINEFNNIKFIGITGTNGKTTSAYLLYNAFKLANIKAAYIGTIGFYIEDKIKDLDNTTPGAIELLELMYMCKEKNVKYIVMEVSSHALSQGRVDGINFNYSVFTNLTNDHLDYHKNMENYFLEKEKLFVNNNGISIINTDDEYAFRLMKNNYFTYGFTESDYKVTEYKIDGNDTTFKLLNKKQIKTYKTNLIGKYNIYNMLTTIIILDMENVKQIDKIVENLHAPVGRCEKIMYNECCIIVDYAHTPDAVSNVILSIKENFDGNIYTVIGCGGNRDKSKRSKMAEITTNLSDYVYFTSDNPRNENPEDIVKDMTFNLSKTNYENIIDRKIAIKKAMQNLKDNDILLVLGKGHETYQIIGDKKYHFDDKEIINEYM